MPFTDIENGRLYYEVHGPAVGSAPVIVFAHGAGGNHLSWWQQVPHFRDRYTCVTFDHRGFGQSREDAGGPGGKAFVDDLRTLLDHLGIDRVRLVAQSMGGWTSLGFTLRHPHRVEKLVMCDTHGGILTDEVQGAWAEGTRAVSELTPGVHPAAGARMAREQPALHFLYTQISDVNTPLDLSVLLMTLRDIGAPTREAVAAIDVPVLFLHGEEDVVIPPRVCEIAATYFRHARFELVPQAGHSVYFERPAAFNALVDTFLQP